MELDSNTVIVLDFNIPHSEIDKSSRQKINKEIAELNCTPDQFGKQLIAIPQGSKKMRKK